MGWRGTIALLALVTLAGAYLWFEGPPKPEMPENVPNLLGEPKLRDPSKFVPLMAFTPAAVAAISIRHGDKELTAERQNDGWKASQPSASLDAFLANMSELGRILEIPADQDALKDYGLDHPRSVVELRLRDQSRPLVLEIGRQNPAATGVYVRVDRQGSIILAGALASWELDKLFRPSLGRAG